jgi:hypothetical protein
VADSLLNYILNSTLNIRTFYGTYVALSVSEKVRHFLFENNMSRHLRGYICLVGYYASGVTRKISLFIDHSAYLYFVFCFICTRSLSVLVEIIIVVINEQSTAHEWRKHSVIV